MRVVEFKTRKGEFILLDLPTFSKNVSDPYVTRIDYSLSNVNIQDVGTGEYVFGASFTYPVEIVGSIKHMTEEQFTGVVDSDDDYGVTMYQNYATTSMTYFDEQITAKESFESLVKSLGWHLWENPYQDPGLIPSAELDRYRKTNDKVFFNPILLRKI